MKSHQRLTVRIHHWALVTLLVGVLALATGCGKKGKKKSKRSASGSAGTTQLMGGSTSSQPTSNALGLLPKSDVVWVEVANPRGSTNKLGLTGTDSGLMQKLMKQDIKELKRRMAIDVSTDAGIQSTGIALDRPMGAAMSLAPGAVGQRLNKRASFYAYLHLHSASAFQSTLETVAEKSGLFSLDSEDLGDGQSVHRFGDACIGIKGGLALLVLAPNAKQVGTTPCRQALNRSREDSLLSVDAARKASKTKGDVRAYHSGNLIGTAIRHAIHRFGPPSDSRSGPLKGHAVAQATIPSGGHVSYSGQIETNRVVGEMNAVTPGKGLIPDFIENASPPAWRGYISEKPAFMGEIKLNMKAVQDWATTISTSLGLDVGPALTILKTSGLTGRIGGYVTMASLDTQSDNMPMPKVSAFAEISNSSVVTDLVGSFMTTADSSDGPTWSLPGPNGEVMWLALRRKNLVFTNDADVLRRSAKAPSRAQWRLPNDSDKQSGVLRLSIPSIAFYLMLGGVDHAIAAPHVEATWSKDPEVAKLVKELQALRDEEATQARAWRKQEQEAVGAFWGTLGDIQVLGTRSSKGVQIKASWQIDHNSWQQLSQKGLELFNEMKEKKRAHHKRWHEGSLKREALMEKIQKLSR